MGYFSLDEDMIGINEKGEVKTWINTQFQSERVGGVKVRESEMVRELLNILGSKIAQETCGRYQNIAWFIGNHDKISFK